MTDCAKISRHHMDELARKRANVREWKKRNPEKVAAQKRRRRARLRATAPAKADRPAIDKPTYNRDWKKRNPEKVATYRKRWQHRRPLLNPEKYSEQMRQSGKRRSAKATDGYIKSLISIKTGLPRNAIRAEMIEAQRIHLLIRRLLFNKGE